MARITIAIPTHNRPRFLIRAVDSVLRQTYSDFELLILDNASEDRRWRRRQAFRDPRVRYISHRRNIGVVANWNAAVATSSCDAISIFHDDDVMSPRFIERIVEALSEWPSAGMVCAAARRVDCLGANL